MTRTGIRRAFDVLTVALFAGALVGPAVRELGDDTPSVMVERRRRAPAPAFAWTAESLHALPGALEAFVRDRFGFRHELIRLNNVLTVLVLGASPIDKLIIGKDHWLFYDENHSIAASRGLHPFEPSDLEGWRCMLEARRDWLAARGVGYVFTIAPDKHTVYPDLLPSYLGATGRPSRYDQLVDYMMERSDVPIVDLRPPLAAARREHPILYYPHGTHWNVIGAHIAYRVMMAAVESVLPELDPRWRREVAFVTSPLEDDSWSKRLHLEGLLRQPNWELADPEPQRWHPVDIGGMPDRRATEIAAAPRPRAVVFHDSFAEAWQPWLSQDIGHVAYLGHAEFDYTFAARERPDVVIQEMVERYLVNSPWVDGAQVMAADMPWTPTRPARPRPGRADGRPIEDCPPPR